MLYMSLMLSGVCFTSFLGCFLVRKMGKCHNKLGNITGESRVKLHYVTLIIQFIFLLMFLES